MKRLKSILTIALSAIILATSIPIPAFADSFNGTGKGIASTYKPPGGDPVKKKGTTKKFKVKTKVNPDPNPGFAWGKTGWRMYLITADDENGNTNPRLMSGTDVIDVPYSNEFFDEIDAKALWTRITDDEVSRWMAPVKIDGSAMPSPKNYNSNKWFRQNGKNGSPRALTVIESYWGENIADRFTSTDDGYNFLVMEPIHWHTVVSTLARDKKYKQKFGENAGLMFYGTNYSWLMLTKLLEIDTNDWGYETNVGRRIPLAAMFEKDWLTLKSPVLTGADQPIVNSRALSFDEIGDYAFAIQAFRGSDFASQSTCDETPKPPKVKGDPKQPHKSPDESDGKWKIHKTYRTVTHENGAIKSETNDGQFLDESSTNVISVEDEEEYNGYKLVAWGTQKQVFTPDFKTGKWEGQCFNPAVQKGKNEATVTMPPENYNKEEVLYLLLERTDIENQELTNIDYTLPESMVTRDITLRYTDSNTFKGYFTASSKVNTTNTETTDRVSATGKKILAGKKFMWELDGIEADDITYCSSKTWDSDADDGDGDWDKDYDTATQSLRFDTKPDLVLGIQNTKFPSAPESIFQKFGEFMGGVKSKLSTVSLSSGNSQKKHELTEPAYGSTVTSEIPSQSTEDNTGTGAKANGANYQKQDTDEWTYKIVIHRGQEKLVVPDWKKGSDILVDGISYTKGNTPNSVIDKNKQDYTASVPFTFADASLKKSVKVSSKIDGKTDWGGEFTDEDDDTHSASYDNDTFKLNLKGGSVDANTKIGVMVYHGMQGVDTEAQYADTTGTATNSASKIHSIKTEDDKPSHIAGSGMSYWANGYQTDTGNQSEAMDINFYPYVQMNYEKLLKNNYESDAQALTGDVSQTDLSIPLKYQNKVASGQTYIMGLYSRGLEAYNFAEVLWGAPASEAHPNLKLQSDQWSTHATVTNDLNTLNFNQVGGQPKTVLPGGAIIKVGVDPDVGDRKVKLVSFQVMPSNKAQNAAAGVSTVYGGGGEPLGGLEQVKATGGGTYTESAEVIPAEFKAKHEAYVKSFIEIFENKNLEHWENKNAEESPFDGVKVWNDPSPSSLGNLETADDNTASAESKYYFKQDASESNEGDHYDRSKESAQESDFDVKVVGASDEHEHDILPNTKTGIYVAWADVGGNVHQTLTGNTSGSADKVNERTMAFTNLSRALERKTGFDNTLLGKKNNGTAHWYSEAFDGVTVVVQETDLLVSLKYPTQRSQVYDPKLTAPNKGGQAALFNGGKDLSSDQKLDHYRSAAFRTNPYDDPDPDSDTGKNRVGTMDCDVFTTGLEWFYVSRRFYIPSATTQDLR